MLTWKNHKTTWATMTEIQRLCCRARDAMRRFGARWENASATAGWPTPAEGAGRLGRAKRRFDFAVRAYRLLDEARVAEYRAGLGAQPA